LVKLQVPANDNYGIDQYTKLLIRANSATNDDITDWSGFARAITKYNVITPTNTTKKINPYYMVFDGSADYLNTNNADFATIKTLEWWLYVSSWAAGYTVFSGTTFNGGYVQYQSSLLKYYKPGNTALIDWGNPSTGAWHHYAIMCDGVNCTTFLDGIQIAQAAYTGYVTNTNDLTLMALGGGASSWCPGYLDEVLASSISRYTMRFAPPTRPYVHRGW